MADPPAERPRTRRDTARTGAVAVLAVVVAVFAVLNLDSVNVDWILGSGRAPLIVVIALSVLLGSAITWLAERAAAKRRGPSKRP